MGDPVFDVPTKFAHHGTGRSIVKPIQCWEGSNGNLKRSKEEAAADIIGNAGYNDANYLIGNDKPMPEKSQRLSEAILYVADLIRSRSKRKAATPSKGKGRK